MGTVKTDRMRPRLSHEKGSTKHTLFSRGREYATAMVDEAHQIRTLNFANIVCTELRHRSVMTVAMTATPVMTSPQVRIATYHQPRHNLTRMQQDLCNLGRFLGLRTFQEEADKMEDHRRALDRAARNERQRRKEGQGEIKLARALVKGQKTRADERQEYNDVVQVWVRDIRKGFNNAILRRTLKSLDWTGKPISGLPDYHEHAILLELSQDEHDVQNDLAEEISNEAVASGSGKQLQVSVIIYVDCATARP